MRSSEATGTCRGLARSSSCFSPLTKPAPLFFGTTKRMDLRRPQSTLRAIKHLRLDTSHSSSRARSSAHDEWLRCSRGMRICNQSGSLSGFGVRHVFPLANSHPGYFPFSALDTPLLQYLEAEKVVGNSHQRKQINKQTKSTALSFVSRLPLFTWPKRKDVLPILSLHHSPARMSTSAATERSVVTEATGTVESTDGVHTGRVALGVLGGLSLVLFVVVLLVPVMRWRLRGGSLGSRRAHMRTVSGATRDVIMPLLEEQPGRMVADESRRTGMITQKQKVPSRPPTALLNWKILETLPDFDGESLSSPGRPLESGERNHSAKGVPTMRLADATRRSAALPPIPNSEHEEPASAEQSRSATLVSTTAPTSPLTAAFQRASTPSSDTVSRMNSISTFRYPSLVASSITSKSPAPSMDLLRLSNSASKGQNTAASPAYLRTPSWIPSTVVSGPEDEQPSPSSAVSPTHNETWWGKPPMTPIPESLISGCASSFHHIIPSSKREGGSPPPMAHLREPQSSAGPSTLSRSSTQHTTHSVSGSIVDQNRDRPTSMLTHATFGRAGQQSEFFAQAYANALLSPDAVSYPDGGSPRSMRFSTTCSTVSESDERPEAARDSRRTTSEYPREPSPPLVPAPLSHPPVLHSLRPGVSSRPLPSIQPHSPPQPQPHSPDEPSPEDSRSYGVNREGSSSSERLLPLASKPEGLELPGLPPLSPLSFDFLLSFVGSAASRNTSRSGGGRHSKQPSKASTISSSGQRSQRSLKSLARSQSGSTSSGSKSRERQRNRRVTFGDEPLPFRPDHPDGGIAGDGGGGGKARRSQTLRPLPSLPLITVLMEGGHADHDNYDVH